MEVRNEKDETKPEFVVNVKENPEEQIKDNVEEAKDVMDNDNSHNYEHRFKNKKTNILKNWLGWYKKSFETQTHIRCRVNVVYW